MKALVAVLAIRVSELPAFPQLEKVSRTDELAKAASKAVSAPVQAAGQFVQKPVETTGSIVSGIGIMVGRTASNAATRASEARYVNNSVMMLSRHSRTAPIASVRAAENVLTAQTKDGKLVVAAPLDCIAWIQPVEEFAQRIDLKGSERSVLLAGKASPRATRELATRGWKVHANVTASR